MDPIIAVYNIKLTVRSSVLPNVGLTNDEVGEAAADGLADVIGEGVDGLNEDNLTVNATTVERVDE